MKVKWHITSAIIHANNHIVLHDSCDFLDARNDTTEKFAEHSSKRTLSGILQPIARSLARRNASVARVYSLSYKCLHTSHRLSGDGIPSRTH